MPAHTRITEHFYQRLSASTSRSTLLKASVAKTGRLLDCTRLAVVSDALPRQLLSAVLEDRGKVAIDLELRPSEGRRAAAPSPAPATEEQQAAERAAKEQAAIYELLDKRMRRHGELAKRETGVHALWLGFPLLYVDAGEAEERQFILAPVLLWPIAIETDLRHEGRIRVGREAEAGPARINMALIAWVRRHLNLSLPFPTEEELIELPWQEIKDHLQKLGGGFRSPPASDIDAPLEPVPSPKLLSPQQSPRFYNSAVLGYFRWPNESILADIEAIKNMESCQGVVAGFISGTRLPAPPPATPPPEEDRFIVCDADFSQERVIWQARGEPGLMVHGPPGTGKSQTIVNMIADALAHGRTVLMVCQKQAATRVVFERLRAAGLADLCLEVHDAESDRLSVFKAIRDQADQVPESVKDEISGKRKQLAREIMAVEDELDRYARALHERHPKLGLSFRQMKAREGLTYAAFPSVRMLPPLQELLADLPAQELDALGPRIESVGSVFRRADPLSNPWQFRQPAVQMSPALRSDVAALDEQVRALDAKHQEHVRQQGAGLALPAEVSGFPAAAAQMLPPLRELAEKSDLLLTQLTRAWIQALRNASEEDKQRYAARCRDAVELARKVGETRLDARWSELCRGMPLGQLDVLSSHGRQVLEFRGRWLRSFSLRFRRSREVIQQLRPDAAGEMLWMVAESLRTHFEAQRLREQLDQAEKDLVPKVQPPARDEKAPMNFARAAAEALDKASSLCQQVASHPWIQPLLESLLDTGRPERFKALAEDVERGVRRAPLVAELLSALAAAEPFLTPQGLNEPRALILAGQPVAPWLDRLARGLASLDALLTLDLDRQQRQGPLKSILDALELYEARRAAGDKLPAPPGALSAEHYGRWWAALVQYTAARMWQTRSQQEYPLLVEITPEIHASKVAQLQDLLARKRAMEAKTIRTIWLGRETEYRSQPWKRMFQLRRSQYGDAKRLREAVAMSLPVGLLAMRPCWLVNPESVAEAFPLQPGIFDLVIFDEASQCPIEQAVPAIFRGKSLIVAGDEKQLPPTSFFSARIGPDDGSSDAEEEPKEQTLDEEATTTAVQVQQRSLQKMDENYLLQVEDLLQASVGNLPESYLQVHYRSETPDLIQFSNRAFYGGRLETPPTRFGTLDGDRRPIQYFDVGGVYDQRTNRNEALKVVEKLKDFWLTQGPCPTLGVVTFNQTQRDLIHDLIEEKCQGNEAFATRYQQELARKESNQDVGFFVKNLENVQGDERDVMIFSTTFGKDGAGRFFRRFGPVGAMGGERRLNVAVTRAKQKIIVIGSMPISDISTALRGDSQSSLTPACFLQLYLAYAAALSSGDAARARGILSRLEAPTAEGQAREEASPPLENELRQVLEKLGYQAHSQIGEAGFRIDLAVLHPDPKLGYILGIECDGPSYQSGRSARIRDVWREEILRRRGWRLHHVWSTRWWYYRSEELEKLKRALAEA